MTKLIEPSQEQKDIIHNLKKYNVIVDAVAGSGKTTTSLHIAKTFSKNNILLLTYNAKLKLETRNKLDIYDINNLEVHSYHSFCVKYYHNKCFTDKELTEVVNKKISLKRNFLYDLIILDEVQDMNLLYFELVNKIFIDNNNKHTRICVLGDVYQSIYEFNEADSRFITFADQCFNFNNYAWKKCKLSTSFRITKQISNFINKCMLSSETNDRINAIKEGEKPDYFMLNVMNDYCIAKYIFKIVDKLLKRYAPEDIFVLAASIQKKGLKEIPIRRLENMIKTQLKNIPVYVPNNDEEEIDDDIIKGKMVWSTFHQAKGRERKVVIVFGFDNSHFMFYKKDKNPYVCTNELYVATTRAKEKLILFHASDMEYLPFVNKKLLKQYTNFKIINKMRLYKPKTNNFITTSVTDLCKHLPQNIIDECMNCITVINKREAEEYIQLESKTIQKLTNEDVSNLNGTAIPLYYEYFHTGKISSLDNILIDEEESNAVSSDTELDEEDPFDTTDDFDDIDLDDDSDDIVLYKTYSLKEIRQHIQQKTLQIDEVLYIANLLNAQITGYIYKLVQISTYDWLSSYNVKKCIARLNSLYLSNNAEYELPISLINQPVELLDRDLVGSIDCIDGYNIYEFKCTTKLKDIHYLQLAIYAYMIETNIIQTEQLSINDALELKENKLSDIINISNKAYQHRSTNKTPYPGIKSQNSTKLKKTYKSNYTYLLYNILTNELNEIIFDIDKLIDMIRILIKYKYDTKKKTIDDNNFIKCIKQLQMNP